VILYVKSRFFFIACGIQLDNGVDSPWIRNSFQSPCEVQDGNNSLFNLKNPPPGGMSIPLLDGVLGSPLRPGFTFRMSHKIYGLFLHTLPPQLLPPMMICFIQGRCLVVVFPHTHSDHGLWDPASRSHSQKIVRYRRRMNTNPPYTPGTTTTD
jgi:hypothetical protein